MPSLQETAVEAEHFHWKISSLSTRSIVAVVVVVTSSFFKIAAVAAIMTSSLFKMAAVTVAVVVTSSLFKMAAVTVLIARCDVTAN